MTGPRLLSELLDPQSVAAGRADAEALTDGRERLTWREYADRVARLAGTLLELGVQPGDRVGVHLPKSVDSFVAVHAVLRAGAVMVPLDALAPPSHTAGVLADAGAEVIVSASGSGPLAALAGAATLRAVVSTGDDVESPPGVALVRAADAVAAGPAPLVGVGADDAAYVMYTSGSTGQPKGIVHTHRSGLAYARRAAETYGLRETDRLANIAPLHFDQSTFELYAAPLAGAAVLVVPDGVLRFPASLSKLIDTERVTVWYSVPYVADQLASRGALDDRDLGALRWVLFGGESFPPAALARLMARLPGARFSNAYGPAEVNQCTFFHLDGPPSPDEAIPIGRPWKGAEVLVVDEREEEVEPGTAGQLLVRTETMMDRYWGRPDLTAVAFSLRAGEGHEQRWYRTGDLVRQRADGNLVFLGRLDNQVKVRGHRIELEAVEAVVADHPGVEACAVVVERPDDGEDHLVALVAPAASVDEDDARSQLVARLRDRLPRYAVPTEIVGVDALPRTGTGKVDRGAAAADLGRSRAGR